MTVLMDALLTLAFLIFVQQPQPNQQIAHAQRLEMFADLHSLLIVAFPITHCIHVLPLDLVQLLQVIVLQDALSILALTFVFMLFNQMILAFAQTLTIFAVQDSQHHAVTQLILYILVLQLVLLLQHQPIVQMDVSIMVSLLILVLLLLHQLIHALVQIPTMPVVASSQFHVNSTLVHSTLVPQLMLLQL
jgi:hypothetical protein